MLLKQFDNFLDDLDKQGKKIPEIIYLDDKEFDELHDDMIANNYQGYFGLVTIHRNRIEFVLSVIERWSCNAYGNKQIGTFMDTIPDKYLTIGRLLSDIDFNTLKPQVRKCTCNSQTIWEKGCQCGYFKFEQENKKRT